MSVIVCVSYRRVHLCYILHFTHERCRDIFLWLASLDGTVSVSVRAAAGGIVLSSSVAE